MYDLVTMNSTMTLVRTPQGTARAEECEKCLWAGTCLQLADLQSLVINRAALEFEYGWDVFGFIGEAKRQYHKAMANGCPFLDEVKQKAGELAPTVDFERVG
jgi:hypothetical protein